MAEVPHFDLPFNMTSSVNEVEQDSIGDVTNCVYVLLATPVNWRPEAPEYGRPDYTFLNQPIGEDEIHELITEQEPRADAIILEASDAFDELIDHFVIEIGARGGRAR